MGTLTRTRRQPPGQKPERRLASRIMRGAGVHIALALGLLTTPSAPNADSAHLPQVEAEAPTWPLAPPRRLTSGFGEYRAGHYHGGIDLSTEQKKGRTLVAAGDGSVWRVRASGAGYGRAVYLRLTDGRTVVTAHMDRFAPTIAAYVEAAQESLGRYEVDLYPPPGRLPVTRGQEIGRSGDSGAGPPHLHLELREGPTADIGVNPLRNGFAVPDTVPPTLRRLVVDELATPEALLTRRGRRRTLPLRALGGGRYTLSDTLRVTGAAVIAIEAFDPGAGGSRGAPWRARLLVDGTPEFELRFDAFDWNRAHEVELVWDPEAVAVGSNYVLRLYRPAGARDTRFQSAAEGAGVLGRAAGSKDGGRSVRRMEIEIEDAAGNVARVDAPLLFAPVTAALPSDPAAGRLTPGEVAIDTLLAPGHARFSIGSATLTFGDSTLFAPGRLSARFLPAAAGGATPETDGGDILDVSAPGVVLDRPMTVMLRPAPGRGTERLALYRGSRGGWSWVGNDATPDGIGGTTRGLGRFALLEDRAAPRVTIEIPAAGARIAGSRPLLRARVADELSGLTWRDIDVTLDGETQIVVYDPESAHVSGRSRRALTPGVHTLVVRVRDRAGNESVAERAFRTTP